MPESLPPPIDNRIVVRDTEVRKQLEKESKETGRSLSDLARDRLRASFEVSPQTAGLVANPEIEQVEIATKKKKLEEIQTKIELNRERTSFLHVEKVAYVAGLSESIKIQLEQEKDTARTPDDIEVPPDFVCPKCGKRFNFYFNATFKEHLRNHEHEEEQIAQ